MTSTVLQAHLNDRVTQHMRGEYTSLALDHTVDQALATIRKQPPSGRIIYFYVVDDAGRLRGVIPIRRLLLSPPDAPIASIMIPQVVSIPDSATVLDACEFFIQHRLLAFPVVNEKRQILGVVDVDLYTDEMKDLDRKEGNEDLFQLIGVHLSESQRKNPLSSFRQRFPWLLCNIAGGILAAMLSGAYQRELAWGDAVLALFIPVVLALAESVGIQSLSLALQTMHHQPPSWSDLLPKLRHELLTGLFLGSGSALVIGIVAWMWLGQSEIVFCLLGGIGGGVACAAGFGLAVPHLLRLFRMDPRIAAGPIALAAADMATLLLYFNFARWLLV